MRGRQQHPTPWIISLEAHAEHANRLHGPKQATIRLTSLSTETTKVKGHANYYWPLVSNLGLTWDFLTW